MLTAHDVFIIITIFELFDCQIAYPVLPISFVIPLISGFTKETILRWAFVSTEAFVVPTMFTLLIVLSLPPMLSFTICFCICTSLSPSPPKKKTTAFHWPPCFLWKHYMHFNQCNMDHTWKSSENVTLQALLSCSSYKSWVQLAYGSSVSSMSLSSRLLIQLSMNARSLMRFFQ